MKTAVLKRQGIYEGDLILVNREHGYTGKGSRRTDSMLFRLLAEIHASGHILPVSGLRTFAEQERIYETSLRENGHDFTRKYVALPGHSEHETGLAYDLALESGHIDPIRPDFPYTGICGEFRSRASSFGFVERYPRGKEDITGIAHEPWHFRYVGCPHAEIMERCGMVLEEYISFIQGFPYGKAFYVYATQGMKYRISYAPASSEGDTVLEFRDDALYSVSGDNAGGYILTESMRI